MKRGDATEQQTRPHIGRRALLGGAACGAWLTSGSPIARAELTSKVVIGNDGWLFPQWEDIRRVSLPRVRQVCGLIGEVTRNFARAKIQMAIVLVPTKARQYPQALPVEFQSSPDAVARYGVALDLLRASGAIVPDLATILAAAQAANKDSLFFKADTHWTAIGAETAAIELARLARPLLPPPDGLKGTSLGGTQIHVHTGDLVGLLPEANRASFPQEKFRIRSAAAATGRTSLGGGLLDNDQADVAVVGNSYMMPYFGFPLVLSNALGRPVELAWQTARIGPYRTLLDFLASPQFRRTGTRMLVWQMNEGSLEQMPDARDWWENSSLMPGSAFLTEVERRVAGS